MCSLPGFEAPPARSSRKRRSSGGGASCTDSHSSRSTDTSAAQGLPSSASRLSCVMSSRRSAPVTNRVTKSRSGNLPSGRKREVYGPALRNLLRFTLLEGIPRDLDPSSVVLLRLLVDTHVGDFQNALPVGHPEIQVVVLVRASVLAEVGAGEVPFAFHLSQRAVDLHEVQPAQLAGLVVLELQDAVLRLGSDVSVDRRLELPAALFFELAGVLGGGNPPPKERVPRHEGPLCAVAPGRPVDADVDQLERVFAEPEVEIVGLLRIGLGVELHANEEAIAVDAACHPHLVRQELEQRVRLRVLEQEDAVLLDPGIDILLDRGAGVLGRMFLVGSAGDSQKTHDAERQECAPRQKTHATSLQRSNVFVAEDRTKRLRFQAARIPLDTSA